MRTILGTVLICGLMLAAGCHAPIAGTWKIAPDQPPTGKMDFGAMTLCHDGTFMAEANYEKRSVVMSGWYKYKDDQLKFRMDAPEHKVRTYEAHLAGDELTMTHEDVSVRLHRLNPCCDKCWEGQCKCKKCEKK